MPLGPEARVTATDRPRESRSVGTRSDARFADTPREGRP